MKKVSMYQLKQGLASVIAEAENGEQVVITRHNQPVARLIQTETQHLHRGSHFGKAKLRAALHGITGGRYLALLQEDRQGAGAPPQPES
jgi:prevent-host-death family protein